MTDNQTRLPMPRALTETSLNPVRPNPMAPILESNGKRKLPQPTNVQPVAKAPRANANAKSLQTLAGRGPGGSGIARPASAASGRHAPSRSVDVGLSGRATGIRPPSRSQAPRMRPGSSLDTVNGKSGMSSDVTMSKVGARKLSHNSGVSSLVDCFAGLHVTPRAGSHAYKKSGERSKTEMQDLPAALSPVKMQTPSKKSKGEPVTPACFLTRESNTRVPAAFNMESTMNDMTSMIKDWKQGLGTALEERNQFNTVIEGYKARVTDLETSRNELEENSTLLRQQLDAARSAIETNLDEADQARRHHRDDIDETRRKHRDELDEMRRDYRDETDKLRRENQSNQEHATATARQDAERLEKRHQVELDDLRRQMAWSLEEEQRARKRDVQTLEDKARDARRDIESGQERHSKDLQEREERLEQTMRLLEREREAADALRRQLARSEEQNADLENATRSLKAQVEFLKSDSKSQSQAFADLEQQTQDALKETEDYKNQLRKEETMRRKLLNQIQDLKGNIRVFCRVRPPLATEMGACAQIAFPDVDSESKAIEVLGQEERSSLGKVTTKTHAFNFDHSFGPTSQNAEIFTELSELVAAVCGGSFNTCVFSYGQTGSGKTYTMASPDGMIARAVTQIFDTAGDLAEKGWRYTITGSFVEVYNENINDLLGRPEDFDKKKHEIRHNAQTLTTEITDVMDVELESSQHFGTVLDQAMRNRSIAATKANERSSRSHSVCILKLTGENHLTGESCRSTLNLVDLAGSERLAHSQATGNRLKETQNINKSLSCLADVIAALGEARDGSHIPYRNSKLTYLLQNSLGGNSKTLMFVMISPLQEHLSETLSSLNFATKVNNTRIIRKQKR